MGNSNPKYYSEREALDLIGRDDWSRVLAQTQALGGAVDFVGFYRILSHRFRLIPKFLCECLYRAVAADLQAVVEVHEFLCALAVLRGRNRALLLSLIFRVYDYRGEGEVSKVQMRKLLDLAYGSAVEDHNVPTELDLLFAGTVTPDRITAREFEAYRGGSRGSTEWIIGVLSTFLEPPPARLEALERKYAVSREAEHMMVQYGIPKSLCDKLYRTFCAACQCSTARPEMELTTWLSLTSKYVHPYLAAGIFRSKLHDVKVAWRFVDFFEFCFLFGLFLPNASEADMETNSSSRNLSTVERQVAALCTTFLLAAEREVEIDPQLSKAEHTRLTIIHMRRLVYLLSFPSSSSWKDFKIEASPEGIVSVPDIPPEDLENLDAPSKLTGTVVVAPAVAAALLQLESSVGPDRLPVLKEYVSVMNSFQAFLPGLRSLSMIACCVFGVRPLLPELEKLYIFELILRKHEEAPQSKQFPNGPIDSEWSVVSASWLNSWRLYVGQNNRRSSTDTNRDSGSSHSITSALNSSGRNSAATSGGTGASSGVQTRPSGVFQSVLDAVVSPGLTTGGLASTKPSSGLNSERQWLPSSSDDLYALGNGGVQSPDHPTPIDNLSILKKRSFVYYGCAFDSASNRSTPILAPNLELGNHLELLPPDAFKVLAMWYGGGPEILRKVIKNSNGNPEFELYPLCLRVCRCDANGHPSTDERELCFSKSCTISEAIKGLSKVFRCDEESIKLWNYASADLKMQTLLSKASQTFAEAGLLDGQMLLVEIALDDGTWPRTQLQEDNMTNDTLSTNGTAAASSALLSAVSAGASALSLRNLPNSPSARVPLNKGRVGLDNLGNTCYMSASLQILLHMDHLVDYFMSKSYLQHVNVHSKHGYKGRLAHAFGKLITNLWCTEKSSISPRNFRQELVQIRDQFSGNEQHDAQELMAFLLDGLSEDLNLVHDKPYIENPDSDGRQDSVLADIWWSNHLKRELSIVNALFSGQFKSVMKCSKCQYTSARYEPFNTLTLPLVEDLTKNVFVDVITIKSNFRVQRCVVTVLCTGTLEDVANKLCEPEFGITGFTKSKPDFLVIDVWDAKVREFHLLTRPVNTIKNQEQLVFYEVAQPFVPSLPPINTQLEDALHSLSDSESPTRTFESPVSTPKRARKKQQTFKGGDDDQEGSDNGGDMLKQYYNIEVDDGDRMFSIPSTPSVPLIRLVVLQRRAKFVLGGGVSSFAMEPISVPVVDVVKQEIRASELYDIVYARLRHSLKAPLDYLLSKESMLGISGRHSVKGGLGTSASDNLPSSPKRVNSFASLSHAAGVKGSFSSLLTTSDTPPSIRPVEIEEAVARQIPAYGFVLRFSRPDGVTCSRCPWLHGCQGCLIPDSSELTVTLEDGMVLAADWHYVVYHELVETTTHTRDPIVHPSVEKARSEQASSTIPLEKCFEKFMEDEKLDVVCPKCLSDQHVTKSFVIWRPPPVMVVQLKRFQFNRYSRRKLTDLVQFPLENLDIDPFVAASSPFHSSSSSEGGDSAENRSKTKYNLFGVVHHVGIMGGGHYVASLRDNSAALQAMYESSAGFSTTSSTSPRAGANGSAIQMDTAEAESPQSASEGVPLSKQWWCFNDSTVTAVKQEDVVSPSAYLLVYMRDDISRGRHRVQDLFHFDESAMEALYNASEANDTSANAEDTDSGGTALGSSEVVVNPMASAQPGPQTGNDASGGSAVVMRSPQGKRVHSTGGANGDTPRRKIGYTEEEFEKIMNTTPSSGERNRFSVDSASESSQCVVF